MGIILINRAGIQTLHLWTLTAAKEVYLVNSLAHLFVHLIVSPEIPINVSSVFKGIKNKKVNNVIDSPILMSSIWKTWITNGIKDGMLKKTGSLK